MRTPIPDGTHALVTSDSIRVVDPVGTIAGSVVTACTFLVDPALRPTGEGADPPAESVTLGTGSLVPGGLQTGVASVVRWTVPTRAGDAGTA